MKPLFLCQLRAQIIQPKCIFLPPHRPNGTHSLSKGWRKRGTGVLLRSCRLNDAHEQTGYFGGSFSLCSRWAAGVNPEKPPTSPRSFRRHGLCFTALSRLLTHGVVESWELGDIVVLVFFLAQLLVYSVDAELVISREKLKLSVTFFSAYLFCMLVTYMLWGRGVPSKIGVSSWTL